MKRTAGINLFISIVLGGMVGEMLSLCISSYSTLGRVYYGFLAIMVTIAETINIICGPDKKTKTKKEDVEDKKEDVDEVFLLEDKEKE